MNWPRINTILKLQIRLLILLKILKANYGWGPGMEFGGGRRYQEEGQGQAPMGGLWTWEAGDPQHGLDTEVHQVGEEDAGATMVTGYVRFGKNAKEQLQKAAKGTATRNRSNR